MNTVRTNTVVVSPRAFILFFLVCNPLIEIIYAMFSTNSGDVLNINRLLRFAALFVMLIDIKSIKVLQKLFCIVVVFVLSYVGICTTNVQMNIGTDISYLLKIYMGFVVYYYFYNKLMSGQLTENAIFSSLIYASIIVSTVIDLSLFGLGRLTYSGNRFGFRGLFAAANLPTSYLLMVLPIAFEHRKSNSKVAIIAIIMSCIALPLLGTKTGVLGTLLVFIIVGISSIHKRIKKTTVVFLLIGSVIAIGVITFIIYQYVPYLKALFLSNSFYHNSIYSFLLSNRDTQVFLAEQYFDTLLKSKKILPILCGVGYSRIENVLNSTYSNYFAVEMDFHAIFFCCGAVIFALVLYRVLYAIKSGFVDWRRTKSQEDFYLLLALFVAIVHAWLGGHTLTDSMCIFPAYIIMAVISSRHAKLKNTKTIGRE